MRLQCTRSPRELYEEKSVCLLFLFLLSSPFYKEPNKRFESCCYRRALASPPRDAGDFPLCVPGGEALGCDGSNRVSITLFCSLPPRSSPGASSPPTTRGCFPLGRIEVISPPSQVFGRFQKPRSPSPRAGQSCGSRFPGPTAGGNRSVEGVAGTRQRSS